ncbi:hypothetical protein JQC67_13360 [Aurantibacter crassamenti]|uniref:heavy metal-binding domain-containing protein n=1 Tax=Aurantibacter crassamenti TaxID=1837375 RepID=UPI001939A2E6|nr:heavy metal-binding domain-containing protein [Aurantibacter crassamenti]MBM1107135.1 hypothetical protein [Aurantibacter crassamenti]
MKVKLLIFPILLFFCSVTVLTSCKDKKSDMKHSHVESDLQYQCPMNCEDGKMYTTEGQCPVCKMDLALIENEHKSTCTVHKDGNCKCEGDSCACDNCKEHSGS